MASPVNRFFAPSGDDYPCPMHGSPSEMTCCSYRKSKRVLSQRDKKDLKIKMGRNVVKLGSVGPSSLTSRLLAQWLESSPTVCEVQFPVGSQQYQSQFASGSISHLKNTTLPVWVRTARRTSKSAL